MKMPETTVEIDSSMIIGGKNEFYIGNAALIISYLREKIYHKNPINAAVREVLSNSRDAHREAKKPEIPVLVHLPNELEPFWSARDYGIGIDPKRNGGTSFDIKYVKSHKPSRFTFTCRANNTEEAAEKIKKMFLQSKKK